MSANPLSNCTQTNSIGYHSGRRESQTSVTFILFVLLLFSMACNNAQNQIVCPNINAEMEYFEAESGQIAALQFQPETDDLYIAYTSGQVDLMRRSDGAILHLFMLRTLSSSLTRISADAQILLSANESSTQLEAWNLSSGESLLKPSGAGGAIGGLKDLALSGNGNVFIEGAPGLPFNHLLNGKGSSGYGFSEIGYVFEPTTVALNAAGDLIAYGAKLTSISENKTNGEVGLLRWNGRVLEKVYTFELGTLKFPAQTPLDQVPIRLKFDPSEHWLGIMTESTFELGSIQSLPRRTEVAIPMTQFGALAFNPQSTLTAVGHAQGIEVFTVPDLKRVMNRRGAQVTSVTFSSDGCLLAWGDVEGTVHIINAPKP